MESISWSSSHIHLNQRNPVSLRFHISSSTPSIVSFPYCYTTCRQQLPSAVKTTTSGGSGSGRDGVSYSAADLLRKPTVEVKDHDGFFSKGISVDEDEENWVDWEDQILEDTVPLVGFVRMILHSGKYENGERLSSEHENIIIQRLLAHHPEFEKKIGCGINYIMLSTEPDAIYMYVCWLCRVYGHLINNRKFVFHPNSESLLSSSLSLKLCIHSLKHQNKEALEEGIHRINRINL